MRKTRAALLGAALAAIPLTFALAAGPAGRPMPGMVVYDAAGHPIGVLAPLPAGAQPEATMLGWGDDGDMFMDPGRIFAQQEAMIQRISQDMVASMQGLDAMTERTIQAAFAHGGTLAAGASQMVITSFSSGNGGCSQTVTYSYPGNGAQPKVAVQKVGDACGGMVQSPLRSIPAASPDSDQPAMPRTAPDGSRLIPAGFQQVPSPQPIRG
ncbi:MAG TPA: hypothetical protein VGH36_02225 [Acetobacteraceae bacterium]